MSPDLMAILTLIAYPLIGAVLHIFLMWWSKDYRRVFHYFIDGITMMVAWPCLFPLFAGKLILDGVGNPFMKIVEWLDKLEEKGKRK